MLVFYVIGVLWKRTVPKRSRAIDLDAGRKSWLTVEEMQEWRAERRAAPWWKRVFRMLFTN